MIEDAKKLALKAHAGQKRKISGEPYFLHVENVAMLLKKEGFSDEVVSAGYLHDVIEDTNVRKEDILRLFGPIITELVLNNTENKRFDWEERKQATILKAKTASLNTKALIAADKLDNSKDLLTYYQLYGDNVWKFFNRGYAQQERYYRGLVEALFMNVRQSDMPHFFFTLKDHVRELFDRS